MAPWPSGKAKVCNTSIPGPIPGGASKKRWVPKRVPIFFARAHHFIGHGSVRKARRIRFANSAKGRSMLAWELLDEFSSRSEPSTMAQTDALFCTKKAFTKALGF